MPSSTEMSVDQFDGLSASTSPQQLQPPNISAKACTLPVVSTIEWHDGIGVLPGTELKFKYNEMGLLEVADLGGISESINLPSTSKVDVSKFTTIPEVKSPEPHPQQKRKRLEDVIKEIDRKHSAGSSKGPAAGDAAFISIIPEFKNRFLVGERLEAVDIRNPGQFCAVTVTRVRGHRLRLHLDGFSTNFDFWVNAYSPFIKPAGYCKLNDKLLQPPKGFDSSGFQWTGYLQMNSAKAAPDENFYKFKAKNPVPKDLLSPGMRLEATHPTNDAELNFRAATIRDILDDQFILVHLDGSNQCDDFWVELDSPFIRALTRPSILAVPSDVFQKRLDLNFNVNMPVECVDPANPNSIVRGTLLKHEKHRVFIRVDEIDEGVSFFWLPEDSYDIYPWGFCQRMGFQIHKTSSKASSDVRPVKRQKQSVVSPAAAGSSDTLAATTTPKVASENVQIKSEQLQQQLNVIAATVNAVVDGTFASPMNSSSTAIPAAVPSGLELSPTDCNEEDDDCEDQLADEDDLPTEDPSKTSAGGDPRKKKKAKRKKYLLSMPPKGHKSGGSRTTKVKQETDAAVADEDCFEQDVLAEPVHNSVFTVEPELQSISKSQSPCWDKVIPKALIPTLASCKCDDVKLWSVDKVADFIKSLPGCTAEHGRIFKDEQIDGEALLLMNQNDIVDLLHIKLGPALKIYNCVAYFTSCN